MGVCLLILGHVELNLKVLDYIDVKVYQKLSANVLIPAAQALAPFESALPPKFASDGSAALVRASIQGMSKSNLEDGFVLMSLKLKESRRRFLLKPTPSPKRRFGNARPLSCVQRCFILMEQRTKNEPPMKLLLKVILNSLEQ